MARRCGVSERKLDVLEHAFRSPVRATRRGAPERICGVRGKGPPEGGPEGSGGFACRYVGLFDLRLANDDFRAVEREIVDLHVEAPTIAVDPSSAYRLPETAFTVLGHGVNSVARAVVCLAHVIFLSSWFESHALCATSWGTKAHAEQRRIQRRPRRGTAKRRGVGREPKATETSGLEGDARAGISPINSKPLVLASDRKEHQWNERPTSLTAIENL